MAHNNHVVDGINEDLAERTRDDYLRMADDWEDPFGLPTVQQFGQFSVVRDDLILVGSKGRFADLLVKKVQTDHIVYIAPKCGYAGTSLAKICKDRGKKLTLFCAASKEISDHQLTAAEYGAEMRFVRIAAMPNLKLYAKQYAEKIGAMFVPMGLKHPLVTAAIVATCDRMAKTNGEPSEVWSAISTGVLSRGLQIGWPNSKFVAVAVARNLKAGELGRASVVSYPKPFNDECNITPEFPSMLTYDAKAWEEMLKAGSPGALFWNVAGELTPKNPSLKKEIKSARDWKDKSDLDPTRPGLVLT